MTTVEIPAIGKAFSYPSTWEECDAAQIQGIFDLALPLLAGDISKLDFQLSVFHLLTGLPMMHPDRFDKHLTRDQRDDLYSNRYQLCQTLDFMFENRGDQLVFVYRNVSNQIPVIRMGLKSCHAPADALTDMTFGEYRMAQEYLRLYRSGDEGAVDVLISILYRPIKDGVRIPFCPTDCRNRARHAKRLPQSVKFYALSWFAYCDNYIKTGTIAVEGIEMSLSSLFTPDDSGDRTGANLGFLGIQLAIADAGTFGDTEGVDRANLYMVLLKLYQWKQENDRIKREYDKH